MSSDPSTNKLRFTQPSEDLIRRKNRRARINIAVVVLALIGLTTLENHFLSQQTSAPIANNIAVLAVFNLILILLFILIVLIARNLVKLYHERKSRIIGSRFQTKLIVALLILALVPSTLLFITASKLFTYSIGSWFNLQVEGTLDQSMDVARSFYSYMEKDALDKAKNIEKFITEDELYRQSRRENLTALTRAKVEEYQLAGIVVFDNEKHRVAEELNPGLSLEGIDLDYEDLIRKSINGEGVSEIRAWNQKIFLAVVVPLAETLEEKTFIWGYIVTLTHIPKGTLLKIESIRNTYEDYKQQTFLKLPVSASYYVTFLLITLLILFSAIWLGFYIARGITVPIQELAKGTRRIAGGDLNFKIEYQANDEIGILVDSFNKMTSELSEGRMKVQRAHEHLKQTNMELERRRSYIETILENIGAGVISIDKKGRVTTFNKAAGKILNTHMADVFGTNYKDTFPVTFRNPIRKMIRQMTFQKREYLEEQIELRVEENTLTLLVNIQVLHDIDQKYLGLVIVFEDLTQMIKTQKVAAWREVAQGIAHEIKNPLTPIQLNTQRLRKKFYEDKDDFGRVFEESIDIISQEVEGMKELLSEFQRFSRMPAPNPKPASLHKIIDDVAILYTDLDRGDITIEKNYDARITQLNLDTEQIRRVFINLFENAVDAVGESGRIAITTRLHPEKHLAEIEFSDNGSGVSAADMNKLFLPHFTTKKRGTGLGLAIVNRIIVDHEGSIQVRGNQPRGTVFTLTLPCASQPSKARPFQPSSPSPY
ncbi:MAG: HAMP domain-containing protein [Nitrospinaceae bacterium]|jgi:two-component system nitrogen regulation sensor histidine kinase NtrY|nr:MAG: HAMP domain-containing protein [Nitrospinaceae bacterium]